MRTAARQRRVHRSVHACEPRRATRCSSVWLPGHGGVRARDIRSSRLLEPVQRPTQSRYRPRAREASLGQPAQRVRERRGWSHDLLVLGWARAVASRKHAGARRSAHVVQSSWARLRRRRSRHFHGLLRCTRRNGVLRRKQPRRRGRSELSRVDFAAGARPARRAGETSRVHVKFLVRLSCAAVTWCAGEARSRFRQSACLRPPCRRCTRRNVCSAHLTRFAR